MQRLLTVRLDQINLTENVLQVLRTSLCPFPNFINLPHLERGQKPWLSGEERSGGRSSNELANWKWSGVLKTFS